MQAETESTDFTCAVTVILKQDVWFQLSKKTVTQSYRHSEWELCLEISKFEDQDGKHQKKLKDWHYYLSFSPNLIERTFKFELNFPFFEQNLSWQINFYFKILHNIPKTDSKCSRKGFKYDLLKFWVTWHEPLEAAERTIIHFDQCVHTYE